MNKQLLLKIADRDNLEEAWNNIKKRDESHGIDYMRLSAFRKNLHRELADISMQLTSNQYKFKLLRASPQDKKTGGIRPLRIATIRDRVVQRAIFDQIRKPLDTAYSIETNNEVSFAYIKGRSYSDAVLRVKEFIEAGYAYAMESDIENFFESVDIDKLLKEMIFPALPDQSINWLIVDAINNEIGNADEMEHLGYSSDYESKGLPQGGILSPLFANVYLHLFDHEMQANGYKMVRYADDFVIMAKSSREATAAYEFASQSLKKLELYLHSFDSEKTKIADLNQTFVVFLGYKILAAGIYPSDESVLKTLEKISAGSARSMNLVKTINYLKSQVNAWAGRFCIGMANESTLNDLDDALIKTFESKMARYNFTPARGEHISRSKMSQIGIGNFRDTYYSKRKDFLDEE